MIPEKDETAFMNSNDPLAVALRNRPRFTDAQLIEVREAALAKGYTAFTNRDDGRIIYLDEDPPTNSGANGVANGVNILLMDVDCVWLDKYTATDSLKAEADGSAATITEVIAAL